MTTTTKTTAQIIGTLTTAEGRQLGNWCRANAAKLAAMPKAEQQAAIRGWVAQRVAAR